MQMQMLQAAEDVRRYRLCSLVGGGGGVLRFTSYWCCSKNTTTYTCAYLLLPYQLVCYLNLLLVVLSQSGVHRPVASRLLGQAYNQSLVNIT